MPFPKPRFTRGITGTNNEFKYEDRSRREQGH